MRRPSPRSHHRGTLEITGTASQLVIKRSPPSRYKTETRVVETTRALRELGFSRQEVKTAIAATRTHVGTDELPIEQWLKIALSHCPKPS